MKGHFERVFKHSFDVESVGEGHLRRNEGHPVMKMINLFVFHQLERLPAKREVFILFRMW